MTKKITYILGAGASQEYLPLANNLSKKMVDLAEEIKAVELPDKLKDRKNELIDNLLWLNKQAELYGTVDTYARKLSLQSTETLPEIIKPNFKTTDTIHLLKRLKKTLFQYFCLKQSKEEIDKRYHKFIASTLDITNPFALGFPINMTILNWNYDFQFELAYSHYYKGSTPEDILAMCASYPNRFLLGQHEFSKNEAEPWINYKKTIYHLNGTASLIEHNGIFKHVPFFESAALKDKLQHIEELFEGDVKMHFAWEKNDHMEKILDQIKDIAKETDVLVVIGYSFPFHNRKMDSMLLECMNQTPLKIIIVDMTDEIVKNLPLKFNLSKSTTIHYVSDCSEFYIPHEL